jgi:hypothetical protein
MVECPTTEAALDIRDAVTPRRAGGWIAPRAVMFTLAAIAQFAISPARADIMWTLSGVTFTDGGGAASGTFTTDASGNLTSADITTTSSLPRFTGTQYDTATGTLILSSDSSGFELETGFISLLLDFAAPLVPSSSPDAISIADEASAAFDRFGSDGSATTPPTPTPEPTTLGLLATAIAFLALRRGPKRNTIGTV